MKDQLYEFIKAKKGNMQGLMEGKRPDSTPEKAFTESRQIPEPHGIDLSAFGKPIATTGFQARLTPAGEDLPSVEGKIRNSGGAHTLYEDKAKGKVAWNPESVHIYPGSSNSGGSAISTSLKNLGRESGEQNEALKDLLRSVQEGTADVQDAFNNFAKVVPDISQQNAKLNPRVIKKMERFITKVIPGKSGAYEAPTGRAPKGTSFGPENSEIFPILDEAKEFASMISSPEGIGGLFDNPAALSPSYRKVLEGYGRELNSIYDKSISPYLTAREGGRRGEENQRVPRGELRAREASFREGAAKIVNLYKGIYQKLNESRYAFGHIVNNPDGSVSEISWYNPHTNKASRWFISQKNGQPSIAHQSGNYDALNEANVKNIFGGTVAGEAPSNVVTYKEGRVSTIPHENIIGGVMGSMEGNVNQNLVSDISSIIQSKIRNTALPSKRAELSKEWDKINSFYQDKVGGAKTPRAKKAHYGDFINKLVKFAADSKTDWGANLLYSLRGVSGMTQHVDKVLPSFLKNATGESIDEAIALLRDHDNLMSTSNDLKTHEDIHNFLLGGVDLGRSPLVLGLLNEGYTPQDAHNLLVRAAGYHHRGENKAQLENELNELKAKERPTADDEGRMVDIKNALHTIDRTSKFDSASIFHELLPTDRKDWLTSSVAKDYNRYLRKHDDAVGKLMYHTILHGEPEERQMWSGVLGGQTARDEFAEKILAHKGLGKAGYIGHEAFKQLSDYAKSLSRKRDDYLDIIENGGEEEKPYAKNKLLALNDEIQKFTTGFNKLMERGLGNLYGTLPFADETSNNDIVRYLSDDRNRHAIQSAIVERNPHMLTSAALPQGTIEQMEAAAAEGKIPQSKVEFARAKNDYHGSLNTLRDATNKAKEMVELVGGSLGRINKDIRGVGANDVRNTLMRLFNGLAHNAGKALGDPGSLRSSIPLEDQQRMIQLGNLQKPTSEDEQELEELRQKHSNYANTDIEPYQAQAVADTYGGVGHLIRAARYFSQNPTVLGDVLSGRSASRIGGKQLPEHMEQAFLPVLLKYMAKANLTGSLDASQGFMASHGDIGRDPTAPVTPIRVGEFLLPEVDSSVRHWMEPGDVHDSSYDVFSEPNFGKEAKKSAKTINKIADLFERAGDRKLRSHYIDSQRDAEARGNGELADELAAHHDLTEMLPAFQGAENVLGFRPKFTSYTYDNALSRKEDTEDAWDHINSMVEDIDSDPEAGEKLKRYASRMKSMMRRHLKGGTAPFSQETAQVNKATKAYQHINNILSQNTNRPSIASVKDLASELGTDTKNFDNVLDSVADHFYDASQGGKINDLESFGKLASDGLHGIVELAKARGMDEAQLRGLSQDALLHALDRTRERTQEKLNRAQNSYQHVSEKFKKDYHNLLDKMHEDASEEHRGLHERVANYMSGNMKDRSEVVRLAHDVANRISQYDIEPNSFPNVDFFQTTGGGGRRLGPAPESNMRNLFSEFTNRALSNQPMMFGHIKNPGYKAYQALSGFQPTGDHDVDNSMARTLTEQIGQELAPLLVSESATKDHYYKALKKMASVIDKADSSDDYLSAVEEMKSLIEKEPEFRHMFDSEGTVAPMDESLEKIYKGAKKLPHEANMTFTQKQPRYGNGDIDRMFGLTIKHLSPDSERKLASGIYSKEHDNILSSRRQYIVEDLVDDLRRGNDDAKKLGNQIWSTWNDTTLPDSNSKVQAIMPLLQKGLTEVHSHYFGQTPQAYGLGSPQASLSRTFSDALGGNEQARSLAEQAVAGGSDYEKKKAAFQKMQSEVEKAIKGHAEQNRLNHNLSGIFSRLLGLTAGHLMHLNKRAGLGLYEKTELDKIAGSEEKDYLRRKEKRNKSNKVLDVLGGKRG